MLAVDRESELPQLASRGLGGEAVVRQAGHDAECLFDWPVSPVDRDRVLEDTLGIMAAQSCTDVGWCQVALFSMDNELHAALPPLSR